MTGEKSPSVGLGGAAASSSTATSTTTTAAASSPSTIKAPLPLAVTASSVSEEMRSLFEGQRKVHEQILKLQTQIEEDEAAYLEETSHGNIIRGWDGFIDSKQSRKDAALKKVKPYTESEHLFSSCCFYSTLALEPTLDLADYYPRDDASAASVRRRTAVSVSGAASSMSTTPNGVGRPSSTTAASAAVGTTKLERKASFSGSGAVTPTLGRPPKIKKRKRFDRLEIASTASATQSETGEDDEKDMLPPAPSSTSAMSLKKSRSTTSDTADRGDFVDML